MTTTRKGTRRRSISGNRLADLAISLAVLAVLALAASFFSGLDETTLTGRASVADGDSLRLGDRRIRLAGIDAPELHQSCRRDGRTSDCGRAARDHLVGLIAGGEVTCRGGEDDRFGRLLARCETGGVDLGAAMVRDGWAFAYGDHEGEEARARQAGRGLWALELQAPRDWRRDHPRDEPAALTGDGGGLLQSAGRALTNLLDWLTGLL